MFNQIAIVQQTLEKHHFYKQLNGFDEALSEIQRSGGSYDAVLALFMEYVEVV